MSPKLPYLDIAVGLAAGIVIAAVVAWLRADRSSAAVWGSDAIDEIVGAPTIGEIGSLTPVGKKGLERVALPAEQFKVVWIAAQGRADRGAVLIAGANAGDGRTTVALNLAASAARDGYRVLLADATQGSRRLSQLMRLGEAGAGFSAVVAGAVSLQDVAQRVDIGEGTILNVLPAGASVALPHGMHRIEAVGKALAEMRDNFDVVIIDSEAGLESAENAALAKHSDRVLVVAKPDSDREELSRFVRRLELFEAKPAGVIVNFAKVPARV